MITNNSQSEECNGQYEAASEKVIEAFLDIATSHMGTISSLGVALTSNGHDRPESWPFLTISNFQQRAYTTRQQSKALSIQLNPRVSAFQRDEWEQFAKSDESYYWM